MRSFTIGDIMDLRPCHDYPRDRVAELWGDRPAMTGSQIGALDIPGKDRVWALVRCLDSDETRLLWAADVAEKAWRQHGASVMPDETRPMEAVETLRRFVRGEAAAEELKAASDAAWAVAMFNVAWGATEWAAAAAARTSAAAAAATAFDVADWAAQAAADATTREAQIRALARLVDAGCYLPPESAGAPTRDGGDA